MKSAKITGVKGNSLTIDWVLSCPLQTAISTTQFWLQIVPSYLVSKQMTHNSVWGSLLMMCCSTQV